MTSPLNEAGAVGAPSNYAPLFTNRFFTGLWTQRNPLRDAATPKMYERYTSRFESLLDGLNREISAKLTLVRRPGHSVYNSQTFPPINRFYEFKLFSSTDEIIRLMADSDATVYDATGPNTKNAIWTKSAGAGDTNFLSVGNTLYFGNGVEQKKWVNSVKSWTAGTQFAAGDFIVDGNNNLQVVIGALSNTILNVSVTSNVVTITMNETVKAKVGVKVNLAGLTTAAYLNGQTPVLTGVTTNQIRFAFVHGDVAVASDTGTMTTTGGLTGVSQPTWPTTAGAITLDGSQQWYCFGSSVMEWGIDAPTTAPNAVNTTKPATFPSWAANTFYAPGLSIVDSNNNIQTLIQSGQLGAAPPVWSVVVGGTTVDNTATWKMVGPAARSGSTTYALGAIIRVIHTTYVTVYYTKFNEQVSQTYSITTDSFYICTIAGISGTDDPNWQDGTGVVVSDGTVAWTNIGHTVNWAGIGASTIVSIDTTILDPNGYKQTIVTSGKSGASAPTWSTTQGAITADGTAAWSNAGAIAVAGSKPWTYAYSFRNSVTGHSSTVSPSSTQILLSANSYIQVQGAGSSDPQVDTIRIWRTPQGGDLLLKLADIPAPAAGQLFTFNDTFYDDSLNFELSAPIVNANDPPATGAVAPEFHEGRVWIAQGNTAFYSRSQGSGEGVGYESFPPLQSFIFPSKIKKYWPTTIGLLVFTVSDIYIILGTGTETDPFYCPGKFLEGIGLLSYDALCVNGTTAYLFTTARKVISLDPGAGVVEVGFPIGDQFAANYDASTAIATWHEGTSGDSALYVADGFTGWYRMAPVAAPESGFVWSTRAIITGGCQAVQSVETAPGIKQLLVGPGLLGGQILFRDSTTRLDNGVAYVAWETIGSIVLAQPGQTAELDFFTFDSTRTVGTSRPMPKLLLGELSGKFQKMFRNVPDPPLLPRSKTIFNDRYYCSQNMQATYCRHFQLRIDWKAENSASELLTYTIFGAIHNERR